MNQIRHLDIVSATPAVQSKPPVIDLGMLAADLTETFRSRDADCHSIRAHFGFSVDNCSGVEVVNRGIGETITLNVAHPEFKYLRDTAAAHLTPALALAIAVTVTLKRLLPMMPIDRHQRLDPFGHAGRIDLRDLREAHDLVQSHTESLNP